MAPASEATLVVAREPAVVEVPAAEPPRYRILLEGFVGGRRLLSDDIALLEAVALLAARRIDAVRLAHERCERSVREEQVAKLATEAELRALRSQLNPHFLFNALTTLGYLMRSAPARAQRVLLDLTSLLRAVLRRSGGDVGTLGQELDLLEAYLAIERERFEERLRVRIDVPSALRPIALPPLLIQPIVENAIKHGIAPARDGGELAIAAELVDGGARLVVRVSDTGVGASELEIAAGRRNGVGLSNLDRRLRACYGDDASFSLESRRGAGTVATLRVPAYDAAAGRASRSAEARDVGLTSGARG
jgi:two-component system LytT family sensor kinase